MIKDFIKPVIGAFIVIIVLSAGGFINNSINDRFDNSYDLTLNTNLEVKNDDALHMFVDNTVVKRDSYINDDMIRGCYYGLFINETDKEVLVAKNVHKRIYPASMTKLVTASVVCDKLEDGTIKLDDVVTVDKHYDLSSEGVGPCDLSRGCQITVKNLMYGLMLYSNNYYALILADYIAGDTTAFSDLMNQKMINIGATNSHFVNPHGLDHPDHYTTAYDVYLIIKEAYSHDLIKEIDSCGSSYTYSYLNPAGNEIVIDISATSFFALGKVPLPAGYNIACWKTGTTDAAGNALALYLTKDGKDYIAIASNPESKPELYSAMVKMMNMAK